MEPDFIEYKFNQDSRLRKGAHHPNSNSPSHGFTKKEEEQLVELLDEVDRDPSGCFFGY